PAAARASRGAPPFDFEAELRAERAYRDSAPQGNTPAAAPVYADPRAAHEDYGQDERYDPAQYGSDYYEPEHGEHDAYAGADHPAYREPQRRGLLRRSGLLVGLLAGVAVIGSA